MLTLPIREILPATGRARIVRIDLDGHAFPYLAGQAVTIASHGSEPRRPYSIAAAPEDADREGCLELLVGLWPDGTPGPHLTLEAGARVDVEGPFGRFTMPDVAPEQRLLFVAGGTGISPLRAMYRHTLARGSRHVSVLYSARTPDDFAYEEELRHLAASGDLELVLTTTRAGDDGWRGARGRISEALLRPLVHDRATLCFICGPQALVDDVPRTLAALGVTPDRIRLEEW